MEALWYFVILIELACIGSLIELVVKRTRERRARRSAHQLQRI